MSRMVIALGGNALGNTPYEQLEKIKVAAKTVADLVESGNEVIVSHGNGPQVGMINIGLSAAAEYGVIRSDMPLPECGAMSQGYIGYHLQNAISNEFIRRGISKDTVTLVTQVVVSEKDPAFQHPTKPIGAFYTKEKAAALAAEKNYIMAEDAGRGYRRMVPSPKPIDIVEKDSIRKLASSGSVVIAAGGGGIPVVKNGSSFTGVMAVVDKDFASEKLAELVDADFLAILTGVDKVCVNYSKPNQRELSVMHICEAERYCGEGQFAEGSMLPKVQAAIKFARYGGTAVITSLKNAPLAFNGSNNCTRVLP